MVSIAIGELLVLVSVLALLGGVIGYAIGADRARRGVDATELDALRRELEDYRGGVTAHFQETAELMQQMTGQYRKLYTHMAQGAVGLCEGPEGNPRIASLQRTSRALADASGAASESATAPADAERPA